MANWHKVTSRGRVEDRRGVGAAGVGLTGILLLLGVNYLLGGNPLDVLSQVDLADIQINNNSSESEEFAGLDEYEIFAATILGSTNDAWQVEFKKQGKVYQEPTLVLFRNRTESGCGQAASFVGPHYCPTDKTIYLDETFFADLENRLGAMGGDVAEAYVIAHEVGHHVQNQLSLLDNRKSNEDSIRTELQADCFAGLWASTLKDEGVFQSDEIKEAMDAAAAVGDDRIQSQTQGSIQPESWTHGSSVERVKAFTAGYQSGEFSVCSKKSF